MSAATLRDPKFTTNGRTFDRFDMMGGHGGPYYSLFSVVRDAIRKLRGRRRGYEVDRCVIRDRRSRGVVMVIEYIPAEQKFVIAPVGDIYREIALPRLQ